MVRVRPSVDTTSVLVRTTFPIRLSVDSSGTAVDHPHGNRVGAARDTGTDNRHVLAVEGGGVAIVDWPASPQDACHGRVEAGSGLPVHTRLLLRTRSRVERGLLQVEFPRPRSWRNGLGPRHRRDRDGGGEKDERHDPPTNVRHDYSFTRCQVMVSPAMPGGGGTADRMSRS